MKVRTLMLVVMTVATISLMVGGVWVLGVAVQLPVGQSARLSGPHTSVGVLGQSTYAWVIPAGDKAVVVIDAGQDPAAKSIRAEVGGRDVLAVLLTHGHSDTSAGIDAFPDATLVFGPGEGALVRGEEAPKGWLASWLASAAPKVRLPETIVEATDGQVLEFGTARIRVTHVPGHTKGSVVYQWRDVAFVGDAVLVKPEFMMMPDAFTDDPKQAKESLDALLPLDIRSAADARGGLVGDARAGLIAFLGAKDAGDPTVMVADALPSVSTSSKLVGAPITVEGVLSQALLADARGLRPARLVTSDGRSFVVSDQPLEAHRELWNHSVVAKGRPISALQLGRDAIPGRWLELQSIEAAAPGDGWKKGQWVEHTGVLESLAPLATGAAWAKAQMDGVAVTVPSTARGSVGTVVTVVGEVVEDGESPSLTARALCVGRVVDCGQAPASDEE